MKTEEMESQLEQDYLKQSVISNIHMMEDVVFGVRSDFDRLFSWSVNDLEVKRDLLIGMYNSKIAAK